MNTDDIISLLNSCAAWRFHREFVTRVGGTITYTCDDWDILKGVVYVYS